MDGDVAKSVTTRLVERRTDGDVAIGWEYDIKSAKNSFFPPGEKEFFALQQASRIKSASGSPAA